MNRTTLRLALFASALTLAGCRSHATESSPPPPPPGTTPPTHAADAHAASISPDGAPPPMGGDLEPPAAPGEFRETAQYLPQGHLGDWMQSGAVTRSSAANLFQIIDGAAVSYERYGVRNYAKTDYHRMGTTLVATIELYEFATPLGAFGRYSLMLSDGRDPGSLQPQSVNRGGGGYQGTTQLTFWKGNVLAQISIADTSEEPNEAAMNTSARESLPRIAEAVEHLVPGQIAPPLSPLPSDNMVWGGNTYLAEGVFGVEQTGAAWVGFYRSNEGKRYRLAIFTRPDLAGAQQVLTRFRALGAHAIAHLGDEAFSVTAPNAGEIVLARHGNNIFAVADGGVAGQPAPNRDAKIAIVRGATEGTMAVLPTDGTVPPPARAPVASPAPVPAGAH